MLFLVNPSKSNIFHWPAVNLLNIPQNMNWRREQIVFQCQILNPIHLMHLPRFFIRKEWYFWATPKRIITDVSRSEITFSSFCKEILLSYHGNSPTGTSKYLSLHILKRGATCQQKYDTKTCFFTLFCSWFKYLLCKATKRKHQFFCV